MCIPGSPGTCAIDQAGLELTEICLPLPRKCLMAGKVKLAFSLSLFFLFWFFSLCTLGCPGTCSVDQDGLEPRVLPGAGIKGVCYHYLSDKFSHDAKTAGLSFTLRSSEFLVKTGSFSITCPGL